MDHPLVSVVVPVYNAAPYVAETLQSVLAQDYPALDCIVLDDGSTDDSLDRLRPFAAHPQVRLLHHANRGEAFTVNRGAALARGAILGVVNADDPLLPGAIAAAAALLTARPDLAAVYPDWRRIDGKGRRIADVTVPEFDYRVLLEQCLCLPGPGAFIRREALGAEPLRDERFRYKSDYFLWLRLGLNQPLARLPGIFATWREHEGGASQAGRSPRMAAEFIDVAEALFARADCPPDVAAWRRQTLSVACYCGALLSIHNAAVPGRALMLRSLQLAPLWPARFLPERRRSWGRIAYVLGQPATGWLYRQAGGFKASAPP